MTRGPRGIGTWGGGIAVLLTAALCAVGCGSAPPPRPTSEGKVQSASEARFEAEVYPIFERKCLDCHHSAVDPPWYAALPVLGMTVRRDIEWGRQRLDLARPYPFVEDDEVGPAGYFYALRAASLDGTMPPLLYRFTHPTSGLSQTERDTIAAWADSAIAAADLGTPDEPLAEQTVSLLRNRCARCHRSGVDDDMNGGFDFVWDVEFLAEDEDYVVAEDSESSPLFERLVDDQDPMPPSPNDRLGDAEIELVRRWIDEGAESP